MNRQELKNILQSAYDRDLWISTLQFLTGKRDFLTVQLSPLEIEIYTVESQRLIKTFFQIGSVKTSDGVSLPIFEISLADGVQIEQNRVGVNEFIKKYIIKDAVRGALVTFSYENNHEKTEWRFSFISKNSASDFFAEAEAQETNPKKFTYIFGNEEEHRTAIERLYNLEQSRFRLDDFFEAFNVEPVSKKFFEEYKHLYREFSDFIIETPEYYQLFVHAKDETAKPEKEIRNFVGRLLGRIVFLYFLQKKNWLGASDENYKDGSTTFLSELFLGDLENQNEFYQKYLCPIFFNALNNPDRENSKFELENGETVCIPFLNGGLFEEEQEPKGHREIRIPKSYFELLFNFFNGFNFTVYENSPEEHTVAVDPEMLGHIFENLIDYNKDTGTFYTPKEIVQYMTQESLIEYLNTHLQKEREVIENLIKNQTSADFENADLVKINELLDAVKICDPAIGSGAFPMGMLQEIFNLKALIAYQLKTDFDPAKVKQNIIQNSIYGVDLDEGAVEIARLRFWLSLVVDEGMPKALPNLDYKIMQGNSLLESYKGIDLSGVSSGNDLKIIEEMQVDLFGNLVDDQMKMTVGKSGLSEEIQKLIKKYFTAKSVDKQKIKAKIQSKIAEHISFNLELRENQLYRQINELEQNLKNLKPNQKKALKKYKADAEILEQTKLDLIKEQVKDEKSYFLWNLFFGDVLSKGGFDIVIGNPPYIEFKKLDALLKIEYSKYYKTAKGKYDIFGLFIEQSENILKNNGIHCYINPTTFMMKDFGDTIREIINNDFKVIEIIDFADYQIFETAITYTGIFLFKKEKSSNYDFFYQKLNGNTKVKEKRRLFENKKSSEYKEVSIIKENKLSEISWIFGNSTNAFIMENIEKNPSLKEFTKYTFQGIASGKDEVFYLKKEEIERLNLEIDLFQPLLKGKDVNKYNIKWNNYYVIYPYNLETNKVYCEEELSKSFPNSYKYFVERKHLLSGRPYFDKSNKLWFELWNERNFLKFKQTKIVNAEIAPENRFQIDYDGFFGNTKVFSTVLKDEYDNLYLNFLGLLNSKLLNYYHKKIASPKAGGFYDYKTQFIQKYPIKLPDNKSILDLLVSFILHIDFKSKIIDIVNNEHISGFFEELIDAVVFEVYFPEEMEDKNLQVISLIEEILQKHKAENFNNIENKNELISTLYFAFKESEVQQKMRQFVTASPDVLKVILQS